MGKIFPIALSLCSAYGCARHMVSEEVEPVVHTYGVEMVAEFATRSDSLDSDQLSSIASFVEEIEVDIRVTPTRNFRDGSEGWRVDLVRFVLAEQRSEVWSAPQVHPLQGLGVELRRFGDGEILHIDQAEYLLGGERGGEAYDLLFPLLSPNPPDLKSGETSERNSRWPFAAAHSLGWENRQRLAWTNHGRESLGEETVWRLSYQGQWFVEGGGREPYPEMSVHGVGPVQGTVWLRTSDNQVLQHNFQWQRELVVEMESEDALRVTQTQDFKGHLRKHP